MYRYRAYGLNIQSDLPLPELVASTGERADVVIRVGQVERSREGATHTENCFFATAREACFHWNLVGTYQVRDGKEIIVEPYPGIEEAVLRVPILGSALAVLLHQRGFLVLHASAVAVDGAAVAFVGPKGRGKSTTAAALYGRGHTLVSDDVVAVDVSSGNIARVYPGYPQFKLMPEAAAASLGDDPEKLPRVASIYVKRARRADDRFLSEPLPLRGVYTLQPTQGELPAAEIKLLHLHDAIKEVIANSYVARFGNRILSGAVATLHLHQCIKLLRQAPVYSIERSDSLSELAQIAGLVEKSIRNPWRSEARESFGGIVEDRKVAVRR